VSTRVDEGTAAAVEGSWPVEPGDRAWGRWALFGVSMSAAVATWVFIIGGYVSYYLPADKGAITMVAGSLVGILLVVLALLPVTSRYGIDSVAASIPQLGRRGSSLSLLLTIASVIGWNTLLLVFLGRAAAEILIASGVVGEGARQALIIGSGLAGAAVVWLILRGGPSAVKNVAPLISAGVTLLSLLVLYLLIKEVGWSAIADAEPSAPSDSAAYNYTTGFEIMVVSMLSWWPYVGGIVRMAPGPRRALWPTVLGLSLPVAVLSFIGLFAGLALPDTGGDPTTFLVEAGGLAMGLPALAFIVLANVGTTLVGVYVSALALKQIPAVQDRVSWNASTAITIAPVAILIALAPDWVFNEFGTFLAFIGVAFAPLVGMQIVDYLVLRRNRVDLRSMFTTRGGRSAYQYWGGINPAGVAAMVAGAGLYIWLLDPVKYTSHTPYEYLSATLPAAALAGAVYYLVTRLVVIPAGRGGYAEDPAAEVPPAPRERTEVTA
jgi:NCS1 family nucleobase:cation symporter-1